MTTISAKVICDSVSPAGVRLTTLQLRYPKFIHGEFMTHRVFSRNASSSRAVPVERMIQQVLDDPVVPLRFGRNRSGMQAEEWFEDGDLIDFEREETYRSGPDDSDSDYFEKITCAEAWRWSMIDAVNNARAFIKAGVHKQHINRLLEPFAHIDVVVTATDWANFFALRRHPAAQPEMRALADAIWDAREASTPVRLKPGMWHLPYVSAEDGPEMVGPYTVFLSSKIPQLIKLSIARCARVSYSNHEGRRPSLEEDLALCDRLVGAAPVHASPAEHQATPDEWLLYPYTSNLDGAWAKPHLHGNLRGWVQYRKTLPGECAPEK